MKFLDQNGVLTLWNKIKNNFFPSTGGTITKMVTDSGRTVSVSILPTSGMSLILGEPSFRIEETATSSAGTQTDGCEMTFPLGIPQLRVYYGREDVTIMPQEIQITSGNNYVVLSCSHSSDNEYAKPIQDLESILV